MKPVPVTQEQMVAILTDVLERVSAGDSFEGFINYTMPIPEDEGAEYGPEIQYLVEARYRVGNLEGQGGMRIYGDPLG